MQAQSSISRGHAESAKAVVPASLRGSPYLNGTPDRIARSAAIAEETTPLTVVGNVAQYPGVFRPWFCAVSEPDPSYATYFVATASGWSWGLPQIIVTSLDGDFAPQDLGTPTALGQSRVLGVSIAVSTSDYEQTVVLVSTAEATFWCPAVLLSERPSWNAVPGAGGRIWSTHGDVWLYGKKTLGKIALADVVSGKQPSPVALDRFVAANLLAVGVDPDEPDGTSAFAYYLKEGRLHRQKIGSGADELLGDAPPPDASGEIVPAPDGSVWWRSAYPGGAGGFSVRQLMGPPGAARFFDPLDGASLTRSAVADIETSTFLFTPASATQAFFFTQYQRTDTSWPVPLTSTVTVTKYRFGLGVFDAPVVPYPKWDAGTREREAYASLGSQAVYGRGNSDTVDLRKQYGGVQAVDAQNYLGNLRVADRPDTIPEDVWDSVKRQLEFELNAVEASHSYWEQMSRLSDVMLKVHNLALQKANTYVDVPGTTAPIATSSVDVNALLVAGIVTGLTASLVGQVAASESIATKLGQVLKDTWKGKVGPGREGLGWLSMAAWVVNSVVSYVGSANSGIDADVNSTYSRVQTQKAAIIDTVTKLYLGKADEITRLAQRASTDLGSVHTLSWLVRSKTWSATVPATDVNRGVPGTLQEYYDSVFLHYIRVLTPLMAAIYVTKDDWDRYPDQSYVHVGEQMGGQDANGDFYWFQLLQQADSHGNLLGQDLTPLLFENVQVISGSDVVESWGFRNEPFWVR